MANSSSMNCKELHLQIRFTNFTNLAQVLKSITLLTPKTTQFSLYISMLVENHKIYNKSSMFYSALIYRLQKVPSNFSLYCNFLRRLNQIFLHYYINQIFLHLLYQPNLPLIKSFYKY